MVHCSKDLNFIFFVYKYYETFSLDFYIFFRHLVCPRNIDLTLHLIFPLHFIIRYHQHCSNYMLFSFFHNFHIFHFPTMRWPTSPLASDGPVPHRLHDRDTHLLYDLYPPVLWPVCVWGGGGESNRVCLCGVEWEHGPSHGLL